MCKQCICVPIYYPTHKLPDEPVAMDGECPSDWCCAHGGWLTSIVSYAKNVKGLVLIGVKITSLELSVFKKVDTLYLIKCEVDGILDLSAMTNVIDLGIQLMKITDLRAQVIFPPRVETVDLSQNRIKHTTDVTWPGSLRCLCLASNWISDLSVIRLPAEGLRQVCFERNLIVSVNGLCLPRNTAYLWLGFNQIRCLDLREIAEPTPCVYARENPIEDLRIGGGAMALWTIDLGEHSRYDLSLRYSDICDIGYVPTIALNEDALSAYGKILFDLCNHIACSADVLRYTTMRMEVACMMFKYYNRIPKELIRMLFRKGGFIG